MTHSQTNPIRRTIAIAAIAALACLGLGSSSASAAWDHSVVEKEFTIPGCGDIISLAVDETRQYVYASCDAGGFGSRIIKRVDYEGNPVGFTSTASHIQNNEIIESPSNPSGSLGEPRIAVDNSGANNGYLFLVTGSTTAGGSEFIDIFSPSGDYVEGIPPAQVFAATKTDIDVGPDGSIYTTEASFANSHAVIAKWNSTFDEVARLYTLVGGSNVAIDTTGAAWELITEAPTRISKYEQDQFSPNLNPGFGTAQADWEALRATPSPYANNPIVQSFELRSIDVDLSRNDLYVSHGSFIEVWSQGTAAEPSFRNAPTFGAGKIEDADSIVALSDHRIFATSTGGKVVRFGAGKIVPDVRTHPAAIDDVKQKSATVTGTIEPAGGGPITGCTLEYGTTTGYGSTAACIPDSVGATTDAPVSAEMVNLDTGKLYHYRFKATNANGENFGVDRTVRPSFVLKTQTLPATNITDKGATLRGSFNPDGKATTYRFQYGVDTTYGLETPVQSGGSGVTDFEATSTVTGLKSGRVWHYRIVASNAEGTTVGADHTFRTASPPELGGVRASQVTESSAILHATIDPVGYAANYRFEYGATTSYGQVIPVPDGTIPAGNSPVEVTHQITGLQPGVTYHFRVIAENEWGESVSADTTFDFAPPSCPNAHVRQQTQSSYLPDCRAYELVSPSSAGAILLQPGAQIWEQPAGQGPDGFRVSPSLNTGLATSPARFTWWGGLGAVAGTNGKVPDDIEMYSRPARRRVGRPAIPPTRTSKPSRAGATTARRRSPCVSSMTKGTTASARRRCRPASSRRTANWSTSGRPMSPTSPAVSSSSAPGAYPATTPTSSSRRRTSSSRPTVAPAASAPPMTTTRKRGRSRSSPTCRTAIRSCRTGPITSTSGSNSPGSRATAPTYSCRHRRAKASTTSTCARAVPPMTSHAGRA